MLKKQLIDNIIKLILLMVFCVASSITFASEISTKEKLNNKTASLIVSPERCVALYEGQTCYQNVILKWRTVNIDNYCLFEHNLTKPLNCWEKVSSGIFKIDFQSAQSKTYYLRSKRNNTNIAETELIVAWVYGNKKRRRASWRLF